MKDYFAIGRKREVGEAVARNYNSLKRRKEQFCLFVSLFVEMTSSSYVVCFNIT